MALKILAISHMYPSDLNEIYGIFVHEQVRELIRQGCEVKVVSPVLRAPFPFKYLKKKWQLAAESPDVAHWEGIEVYYPGYITLPGARFFEYSGHLMHWGFRKCISRIYDCFRFDLVHAHVALPDGFAALFLKQKYGKPLIVTIHGQDLQQTIHRNEACKKALLKVFIQADRIITVSAKLKNILVNLGLFASPASHAHSALFDKSDFTGRPTASDITKDNGCSTGFFEKTSVIGNGVAPDKLLINDLGKNNFTQTSQHTECAAKYAGYKVMLSVSNLKHTKGVDINLKAFAQLFKNHSSLKYLIIGDGPELNNLKRLTSRLHLDERVEFLGKLPHVEVMRYMAAADIFSLPSWSEGFGVVYIEAMVHGKPVIACRGEGIDGVVIDGETGLLVKPRDIDSLVKALDFLLCHPEKAVTIGERARRLVLEEYTWEKNAAKTIKLYKETLATQIETKVDRR